MNSDLDMAPDIDEILGYHLSGLTRALHQKEYRTAWQHSWMLTAALYYKCRANHMKRLEDDHKGRPL